MKKEDFLHWKIKDLIEKHREVGEILQSYGIGCVECQIGSCLLKDIVEIHNLTPQVERELIRRIAEVLYPGEEIDIPLTRRKVKKERKELSPPLKKLVQEHVWIKKWVEIIPDLLKKVDLLSEEGKELLRRGMEFVREYADRYHHAKEEDILFKYFDENLEILKVIRKEHQTARSLVRQIVEALNNNEAEKLRESLKEYSKLLQEHIKKEDEILYPWMDRNLTLREIGELFANFQQVDEDFGDLPQEKEVFIEKLEKTLKGGVS